MKKQSLLLPNPSIPAIVYGEPSREAWLYVHGKHGAKEEAEAFAGIVCPNGPQVLAIDLPEHGARRGSAESFDPWHIVPELQAVMAYAQARWSTVSLRATSIGAYVSLLAFQTVEKALLVSPILDMEQLICQMLLQAGVSEKQLREQGIIPAEFGETLSWQYLSYVREHPLKAWRCPIRILYAGLDTMTSRETVEAFARQHGAELTVLADGEHWFHTQAQIAALSAWERASI